MSWYPDFEFLGTYRHHRPADGPAAVLGHHTADLAPGLLGVPGHDGGRQPEGDDRAGQKHLDRSERVAFALRGRE